MVNTQLKILRVFGPTGAEVSSVLRGIRDDGCPGLRLLERDGEFAICVQVSAPNRAMAEQYCDKWAARLRAKFGDDVFAEGETSLAQATLDALLEKRKLLVAVDEPTGRLLGSLLQPLPHSEAVFDFGTESYADPQKSRRITVPEQLLRRFPGDIVQAAAGRALAALQVTGADYAAAYMPASVGQCPFVLVCDRRGAVACALPPDMNDTFIGNQILDLLRRRLFGLQLTDSCITFRPGHDRPLLVVSEAARSRGNTVRFSLRRRKAEKPESGPVQPSIKNRSLEIIEKSERRRRRTVILGLVVLALVLALGGGALWLFLRCDLGARPAAKSYGTALYDTTAENYLGKALERRPGVVGYLGWPGLNGALVYAADTPDPETPESGEAPSIVRFATPSALDAATPGNTVVECTGSDYKALADEDTLKQNSGFTLYTAGGVYRFKAIAVYYFDPSEQGAGAFDLYGSTDLSSYYDYLTFVAGIQARSLFDTGVDVGDDSRFLTVTTHSDESGVLLCITGRLIREGETELLNTSAIAAAEEPLLTAAQYERKGQPMPTVSTLVQASVDRYAQQSTAAQAARKNGGTGSDTAADTADLAQRADDLQAITDSLLASTDKLLAGLTDVAGSTSAAEADLNKGAEGSLPEQTVTVDQIKTSATPAPTEPPADSAVSGETTTEPTAAPTEAPQPDNSGTGETINVTMNGTAQTMDLVQCLAMVAQNELGPNAPAEAYKAQCVATHCWILSQSGYPSVLGAEPGAAALAAAQEVAHVLVTYNGQVCFTPYFASASTGTASAAEVWGNDRAWLQAVDSPYDQSVSSHWNTNGNSSGTARFSRQTLQDRIRDVMDIDLSGVDPNSWFTIQSANQYGWVAKIQVGPDAGVGTVSGRWFRENLLARQSVDGRSLRSQCFTVSYNADLDCFIFDVYGYGHGCGMSQWGAIGYARNGWGYQDILTHYFVGTTITTY